MISLCGLQLIDDTGKNIVIPDIFRVSTLSCLGYSGLGYSVLGYSGLGLFWLDTGLTYSGLSSVVAFFDLGYSWTYSVFMSSDKLLKKLSSECFGLNTPALTR